MGTPFLLGQNPKTVAAPHLELYAKVIYPEKDACKTHGIIRGVLRNLPFLNFFQ